MKKKKYIGYLKKTSWLIASENITNNFTEHYLLPNWSHNVTPMCFHNYCNIYSTVYGLPIQA